MMPGVDVTVSYGLNLHEMRSAVEAVIIAAITGAQSCAATCLPGRYSSCIKTLVIPIEVIPYPALRVTSKPHVTKVLA